MTALHRELDLIKLYRDDQEVNMHSLRRSESQNAKLPDWPKVMASTELHNKAKKGRQSSLFKGKFAKKI